jgi:uroporphyrinogen decarboxylase
MRSQKNDFYTPRQRFLTALCSAQPDRVPIFDFLFSQSLFDHFLGQRGSEYTTENLVRVTWALGLDAVAVGLGSRGWSETDSSLPPDRYRDEWGVIYRKVPQASWPGGAPIAHPVSNREDWHNYQVPDPESPAFLDEVHTAKRMIRDESLAIIGIVIGPFTAAWQITGLESFFLKLHDDPQLVVQILETVTDFYIRIGERMAEVGVDCICIADDLGHNSGPFLSPLRFRQFILPHIQRMVVRFQQLGLPVLLHCDGDIRLLLDDLVSAGIQGYHPIERSANMDLAECKRRYAGRLCLVGNVDNKGLLVSGTPDQIEAQVRECLRMAAPGGGYVLASDHSLHDDIPLENVLAMFEAARRYGDYATRGWER